MRAGSGGPAIGVDRRRHTLVGLAGRVPEWLLFARLALTAVSFAIAIGLEGPGGELSEEARHGLFATVALAFGATAISGTLVRSLRNVHLFGAVQIAIDVAIVTALVHFSGGSESVFAFLYVLVTVYAALLFERKGAVGAATSSAVCYAAVLLTTSGHLPSFAGDSAELVPLAALGTVWGIHVGAFYLVGALASVLARDLHLAGQELDRSANDLFHLRSLHERTVESIMSGLLTCDLDGRVISFNRQAEHITGMKVWEALGRPAEFVIPGVAEVAMRGASEGGSEPSRARLRYSNRRGEELYLGLTGSVLRDADGTAVGHVIIFQDVTEVVAMEIQLRRSERLAAVGEMSAKIAHEIRNPLAAISGSVQILRKQAPEGPADSEPSRLMDIVVREADRLSSLIQDFLQYARPRQSVLKSVDLAGLARDVLELFESARPDDVTVEIDAQTVFGQVDRGQIEQVLWNLLLNAVQAMPEGGELHVSVTQTHPAQGQETARRNEGEGSVGDEFRSRGWAEICVADTGVGITPEVQELMFEPFFTTKQEGSGLGLSTVHRIIEGHGGQLQVAGNQGCGTSFWVRLPLAECPQ